MLGKVTPKDGVAAFDVPFSDGLNQLEASVNTVKDVAEINFLLQPSFLKSNALPFREINISLGDNRCFVDEKSHQVWIPNGRYDLTLHFAELISDVKREALVYNLDNKEAVAQKRVERTFDVLVNGVKMIDSLGSANYLIPETAYNTRLFVDVKDGKGILIQFIPLQGETILNGVQLRKIF